MLAPGKEVVHNERLKLVATHLITALGELFQTDIAASNSTGTGGKWL